MRSRSLLVLALVAGIAVAGTSVRLGGALIPRFTYERMGSSFDLMSAEGNIQAQVTSETRDILTALIQVRAGGAMSGWTSGFHFGEAYALFPLGLSLPTIRVGQAVIPFGLLADYDIHTQIIQTPYARTLGLRLDPGLGVLGVLGHIDYRLWLSNGNGPDRMDNDMGKVFTVRLAPRFLLGDADVTLGLSGLYGSLPYWSLDSLAKMDEGPRSYKVKYRLGLDNTTDWGPLTLRLEGVAGKDSTLAQPLVFGYYGEARYALVRWLEPMVAYDGFHTDEGSARTLSAGLNFYPPNISAFEIQTAYQRNFLNTATQNMEDWHVIAQLVVRF
ncbi:MAG: hypothetical protein NTX53_05245 [candidate division WOR-3 bacterium]|nr:hypothetical protein [candidate division WOR-3 bacterium]